MRVLKAAAAGFGALFAGLSVVLALSLGLAVSQAQTAATVYEGALLIDGNGGAPVENSSFVVEGGRFTQVGRAGQLKPPAGAARVSLAGKTVIPALIDTHVHVADSRDALVDQLRGKAYWGVGGVMSMGTDPGDLAFTIRNEVIPGAARLKTAGRGITTPEPGRTTVPYWITTEAEGRKAVQELASRKVDIVKMWVDDRDGKYKKLSPDLYGPVINEAHKNGLRVTAHIFTLEDAKGLLKAGVDAFAHSVRDKDVDDELMTMIKARPSLVLNPNLPDRGVAVDMSWLRGTMSEAELKKLQGGATDRPAAQQAFGIQARNLKRMSDAGVKIVLGTDGLIVWSQHVEMADMVASGMTPAQVIVASTKSAAEFLHLADSGTVQANKRADFVVLDANPLADITNTRKISAVYLAGSAVDREAMRAKWMGSSR
jgi:imidazolonepropionase-like amidohydrolase